MSNKLIAIVVISIASYLSGVVMDLPDIEISGPSALKSTLEKRGIISSELNIPDVVDSLKPIIPTMPESSITYPRPKKQSKNALYSEAGNSGIKSSIMLSELFSQSNYFTANAGIHTPAKKWYQKELDAGIHHITEVTLIDFNINHIDIDTPKNISYQSDSSLQLMYDFNYNYELAFPYKMKFQTEFESYQNRNDILSRRTNKQYWNNQLTIKYLLNNIAEFTLDGSYIQESPILALKASRTLSVNKETWDFFKGVSLYISEKSIVPGIALSKRFSTFHETSLLICQESGFNVWNNYTLFIKQPWQYNQREAIISFYPLSANISMLNSSLEIMDLPLNLSSDYCIRYSINQPVLKSTSIAGDLPVAVPETVLESSLKCGFEIREDLVSFTQSFLFDKGWMVEHKYSAMSYLPMITSESSIDYTLNRFKFNLHFNQYYNTKDDTGAFLRDALDLGATVKYTLNHEAYIYLKLSNLLYKGKIVYRNLPAEPVELLLGLFYKF